MARWLKETIRMVRLQAQGKRELRRLPLDEWAEPSLEGWLARYWSLPPEAWPEAVDLRVEERELRRDSEVQGFPGFGWFREPDTEGDEDAEARKAVVAARWADYEARYRRFWRPESKGDVEESVPPRAKKHRPPTPEEIAALDAEMRKLEEDLRPGVEATVAKFARNTEIVRRRFIEPKSKATLAKPWRDWIASLPDSSRDDGTQACLLWKDMIDLRNALRDAVDERASLAGVAPEEARRVLDVRMLTLSSRIRICDEAYRRFAEPFFREHGHPPVLGAKEPSPTGTRDERALKRRAERHEPPEPGSPEASWTAWLRSIPETDRSDALRVRVLYDDLQALRWRLAGAMLAKHDGGEEAEERIKAMEPELARADRDYRRFAEPLFKAYGKPDLPA